MRSWTGAANSDWYDPANWSPTGAPDPSDTLNVPGGSPNLSPPFTLTGQMNWTGGSFSGGLTVGGGGTLHWQDGGLSSLGSLTVEPGGMVNLEGPGGGRLITGQLTNRGAIHWLDGGMSLHYLAGDSGNQGEIWNEPGGLIDIQCDQTLSSASGYTGTLHNAGLLRKSGQGGTTTLIAAIDNAGTIETRMGTFSLLARFSNAPSGSLAFLLGGTAPGTDYGQLQFNTPVALNGTVAVSTRNRPNPGDTFQVLSYPSATGDFSCFSGLDLGGGLMLVPGYARTSLTLVATTYDANATEPRLFITRAPGGVRITWPLGFPDWHLHSCTNLVSKVWIALPAQCGNQALVPVTLPQHCFQLLRN